MLMATLTNADQVNVTVDNRTGHLLPASHNHFAYSNVGIILFGAESYYVALVIKNKIPFFNMFEVLFSLTQAVCTTTTRFPHFHIFGDVG